MITYKHFSTSTVLGTRKLRCIFTQPREWNGCGDTICDSLCSNQYTMGRKRITNAQT